MEIQEGSDLNQVPFILDGTKELRGIMNSREYQTVRWNKLKSKMYWHKFIVRNSSNLPKEFILRLILDTVSSTDFTPVKFHVKDEHSIFYARDCLSAIEILLRFNLRINIPKEGIISPGGIISLKEVQKLMQPINEKNKTKSTYTLAQRTNKIMKGLDPDMDTPQLILQIEIGTEDAVTSVSAPVLVANTITKRYSAMRGSLDLSNFHNDPDLEPHFFYALSVYKVMTDVISYVCANAGRVTSIDLSNNFLFNVESTKALLKSLNYLTTLDLSNNKLAISALQPLFGLNIKELYLDGNPLCESFMTEMQYINEIRKFFPELQWLDGVRLCQTVPMRLQSFYLCAPSAKQMVEQFIEHFFSLYDSPQRGMLLGTYHPDAMLSITCNYLPGQTTSANARLSTYIAVNRNLLRVSDYSKIDKLLRKNNKEIMELFCKLPTTEHDPSTFTAELLYFSTTKAVLSITGLFREPTNPGHSIRYFKRQFTLLPTGSSTFFIRNELLHVANATTAQAEAAFQSQPERPPSPLNAMLTYRQAPKLHKAEKKDAIDTVSDLTEMNRRWSRKCLADVKWDIRSALILFNNCYKAGEIPLEAFIK